MSRTIALSEAKVYKVRRKERIVLVAVGRRREVYEGLRKFLGK